MNTRLLDARAVHTRGIDPTAQAIGPIIGMTTAEVNRASLQNFIRATAESDRTELAFFAELSQQVEAQTGRRASGFSRYLVPGDVTGRRDLTKGTSSAGGFLVGTGIGGFSHALDAASVIGKLPITKLPNLVGDVTITRESIKGTAGWLAAESSVIPTAESTFGSIALTPKTVAGTLTVSRQLLLQTGPAAQAFIDRALAVTVAEAVDRALVAGSGASGEPLGIANTANVDTRTGASFSWTLAQAMIKVASGWATSDSIAWVAGVDAAEDLKTRERASGSGFIADAGMIDGKPLIVSRGVGAQVAVCAPWSQTWMASWGALELAVDPSTYFRDGRVQVRAMWTVDFAHERAQSVAIATALT